MVRRETAVWMVGFGWLACVLGGFWLWERYDATPGVVSPSVAAVPETRGRWALTVFVHPRCPCTRATIRAAAEIAAARPGAAVRILFVRPPNSPDGWERGESWDFATRIPGAEVARDDSGEAARRYGAETSGHAVLTDPAGAVAFRGGLTQARGRAGGSVGLSAVLAWTGDTGGVASAPVFGCDLFTPGE